MLVLLLALLEMTFIFVGFCLLHSQRKVLGSAAFYMTFGLMFLMMQLVYAADLQVQGPNVLWFGLSFRLSSTVFFMPCLAALLLLYVTEGTLAIQRFIIGLLVLFGIFFYLGDLTRLQCAWQEFSISQGIAANTFEFLLERSRQGLLATLVAQIIDLFLLPIVYTRLRNSNRNLFCCLFGALMVAQLADSLVYMLLTFRTQPLWPVELNNTFVIRTVTAFWFGILLTVYIHKFEQGNENKEHNPLEIVFAFFGGYGRSKMLEKNLLEWEGRYKMVVENATEMVILIDNLGMIIECNPATAKMLKMKSPLDLANRDFFELMYDVDENMRRVMLNTPPTADGRGARYKVRMAGTQNLDLLIDLTISPINVHGVLMLIVFGRDITEETHLAEEREMLREQLAHSQRLESLGKLAGGVAHDFNNYVHAILGHIDVINMIYAVDNPKIKQHLDKIEMVAEQASRLTGQLLGFARKGKYQEAELELRQLLLKSVELFRLSCKRHMKLIEAYGDRECWICGDQLQLQQVIVNLLINARDAMRKEEGYLPVVEISLGEASQCPVKPHPMELPPEGFEPADFYYIMIRDNGRGMNRATMQRIFEPFFTTKPVGEGTGMGLAMVYGTINHHHGAMQVLSRVGKGTTFIIFLPKLTNRRQADQQSSIQLATEEMPAPEV
ncbi:ATP-binding protein [Victivallis sp. Marseille-Q1083]|uniref:PAS domain-containing sensor histidine kinase n=1 Tax=Victivallis sp. Marseille-Q1083 TaxID=2717288 RepID=UPI0020CA934D|nr:ATP-binding protein [Victivallis sp. Marseille-Q1083]